MDATFVSVWSALFKHFAPVFSARTAVTFLHLCTGWALCRSRPWVTSIFSTIGSSLLGQDAKHWTVYHKLFYRARWDPARMFRILLLKVVLPLLDSLQTAAGTPAPLYLALDETTFLRYGKRVFGAGYFRDASASNAGATVIRWANCWLISAVLVRNPRWPKWVTALPIGATQYLKESDCDKKHPFKTTTQLAAEQISAVSAAIPGRKLIVVADGHYASAKAIGTLPPDAEFISRMRCDASLCEVKAPLAKPRRGRPTIKGTTLPTPKQMTARRKKGWKTIAVTSQGGSAMEFEVLGIVCLWPRVRGAHPIKLVLTRDPKRGRPEAYLFSTDPTADEQQIVQSYCDRWAIEECIREPKQYLGMEQLRGWCRRTVERQVPVALVIHTLVKVWYMLCGVDAKGHHPDAKLRPWRKPTEHPSFLDMLTTLRSVLWSERIKSMSGLDSKIDKSQSAVWYTLIEAA